jgi:signal transduction histidine kinase/ActR/RegA family two-component response regulator
MRDENEQLLGEVAESEPGEALAQVLLMQAPVAIALLDGRDLRFRFANRHYRHIAERHELAGLRLDEACPEMAGTAVPALMRDVLLNGKPHVAREVKLTRHRHGRPQECIFRFQLEPHRDASGRVGGVMVVASEVTDEVRSRHALETAFKERQRLAVELDRASRTKREFLAMLGHELRNPLAPIVSALELMQLKGASDTRWEQGVIARQVDRLTRLLDDLLGAGSGEGGPMTLQRQPVEIADMLAEAADMVAPLLKSQGHRLDIDVERGRLACRGDPLRLAQAVANLLNNAARYTEAGGRIAVGAWRDQDQVVIRVKDDGCGIAPEILPRVFELFFQGPQAHRPEGGMGVGLTIARNLVEMHGGTVSAASDGPGHGAEFVIRLPRMTEVDAVTDRHLPPEFEGTDAREAPRRLRILVVDDNEDTAESLAQLLHMDGHQVTIALSPQQALEVVPQLRPHVALLDIGLPGMSGHDLGLRIREMLRPRSCRLFAITGYSREGDRQRSAELGFVDHLIKPVNHEVLLRHIADAVPSVHAQELAG